MGRDLQKRKNRSSRSTIRQSNKYKKPLNPMGNSTIAQNWNKKETLSQNYRRLGLVSKLGKATGGVEAHPADPKPADPIRDAAAAAGRQEAFRSVKVQRDAGGNIVRVLRLLNDPLDDLESGSDGDGDGEPAKPPPGAGDAHAPGGSTNRVVRMLEREAAMPEIRHVRHQSQREREWLQGLLDKHGNNTVAMARDLRLNPMQQTAAAITKKLMVYRKESKQ